MKTDTKWTLCAVAYGLAAAVGGGVIGHAMGTQQEKEKFAGSIVAVTPSVSIIEFITTNDGGGFTAIAKYEDSTGQHYADTFDGPIRVEGLVFATLVVQGGSCSIEYDGVKSSPIEADPIAICLLGRNQ